MTIQEIILTYYRDYLESNVLTTTEVQELLELLGIIMTELQEAVPTEAELLGMLKDLRAERNLPLTLLPICLGADLSLPTYIDMLHGRELQGDQRTAEWKMQRHKFITASVSAACAGLMGPASRDNQLLEKASMGSYSTFKGGYYTDIGNIFEPATNYHYSYINNTRIHDFALIPSEKEEWKFLAASTDGVAANGTELTNIEIKTLPGRVPDGKVKKVYYHQMQHQMECLNLSHSDFIEVKYEQMTALPDPDRLPERPIGVIAEVYHLGEGYYDYEHSSAGATLLELQQWQESRDKIIKNYHDRVFTRWIYWVQTHYSCIRVERDPNWLLDVGPALKEFQEEVVALRNNPKKVQQMIRERELRIHKKRTTGNALFGDCLI
jgi:hypothetical protein